MKGAIGALHRYRDRTDLTMLLVGFHHDQRLVSSRNDWRTPATRFGGSRYGDFFFRLPGLDFLSARLDHDKAAGLKCGFEVNQRRWRRNGFRWSIGSHDRGHRFFPSLFHDMGGDDSLLC